MNFLYIGTVVIGFIVIMGGLIFGLDWWVHRPEDEKA